MRLKYTLFASRASSKLYNSSQTKISIMFENVPRNLILKEHADLSQCSRVVGSLAIAFEYFT
jgi:hypothetical protein